MLASGLLTAVLAAAPLLAPADDREDALEIGRLLIERRDFDGAVLHLEPLAAREPDDHELQLLYGMALFADGRFEDARAPFEALTAAAPEDALPWEFLGRIEFQLGRLAAAAERLRRAAAIDPRDGRTFNHLGAVLSRMDRRDAAREAFRDALALDPSYATAHYNLGVLSALGGDALAGVYHLREAARLDRTDDEPTEALAELHLRLGDLERALAWFRESARRAPGDVEHRISVGETQELLGRPFEAEVALVRACELAEDDATPFLRLAGFLARRVRVRDAIAAYRAALERDDASRAAHEGIADLAEDFGDDALAREHLERLVDLGVVRPELLRRLCLACDRLGDAAAARSAFRRMILESDGDHASLRAIAEVLATSGVDGIRDVERGRELAAALVERTDRRSAAALFVLSRAEEAAGDQVAAATSLERAAELFHAQEPEAVLLRRLSEQARAGEEAGGWRLEAGGR